MTTEPRGGHVQPDDVVASVAPPYDPRIEGLVFVERLELHCAAVFRQVGGHAVGDVTLLA